MINMSRPPIKKSPAEENLDRAMADYEAHFGRPYVFQVGGPAMGIDETIEAIRRCIDTDTPQELIKYDPKNVY